MGSDSNSYGMGDGGLTVIHTGWGMGSDLSNSYVK